MSKKDLMEVYEQTYNDYVQQLDLLLVRIEEYPETASLDECLAHTEWVRMVGINRFLLDAGVIGLAKFDELLVRHRDQYLKFSYLLKEVKDHE